MMGRRFECYDWPTCYQPGLLRIYNPEYLWEKIMPLLNESDIKVINLETPLTEATDVYAHPSKSIVFKSHPDTVDGLIYAGIDIVSLANNHAGDYSELGIIDTRNVLKENSIKFSGAGLNSYEAHLPEFVNIELVNIVEIIAHNHF